MIDLIAENSLLRLVLLLFLFAVVAVVVYFLMQAITVRQFARQRLLEGTAGGSTPTLGSLRAENVESAWLKLVNTIERRGLSLVDSKDEVLRHKLIMTKSPDRRE